MKTMHICSMLAGFVHLLLAAASGQVTDVNIRTWTQPITNWNMEDNQTWFSSVSVPSGMTNDKIVSIKVLIYSDGTDTEVFNLTRLSNDKSQVPMERAQRAGGWASISITSTGIMDINLDRGDCVKDAAGVCADTRVQSFFAARSVPSGSSRISTTFWGGATGRVFHSTSKIRGVLKVEYICNPCSAPTTNVFWKKIGSWNMTGLFSPTITQSSLGIQPANIVDMSAAIVSDPGVLTTGGAVTTGTNAIIVDDLEHHGTRHADPANGEIIGQVARGGFLWLGFGCATVGPTTPTSPAGCASTSGNYLTKKYNFFAGPNGSPAAGPASYRSGGFSLTLDTGATVTYNQTATANRGWLRVEYKGTKSSVSVPYAFKSKAIPLGSWPMDVQSGKSIEFLKYGIAANRVSRITTTINSNPLPFGGGTYRILSNFSRQRWGSGVTHPEQFRRGGGTTLINEYYHLSESRYKSDIKLQRGAYDLSNYPDYYSPIGTSNTYNGTSNRGYVLVDYLAGSCEQGPGGGYKIRGLPGRDDGDCTGSSQPFAIEGAGRGTPAASLNTRDSLTYVYKSSTNTNLTVSVRVESFDANAHASALAGVMFRATLDSNSRNAALMALPGSAGISFRRRTTDGSATSATGSTAAVVPCWLRVQKAGNTFTAFRNPSPNATMPTSGWVNVGSVTITFPTSPTPYYYGLQVSNFDSPRLTKVTMQNLTVQ